MKKFGCLVLFVFLGLLVALPARAQAVMVGVGPVVVGVGPVAPVVPMAPVEPVCSWGYYPYYPYACAPYGYYGPNWFVNGYFIGAGPWLHFHYGRPMGYFQRFPYRRGYDYGYRSGYSYGRVPYRATRTMPHNAMRGFRAVNPARGAVRFGGWHRR